MFKPLSNTEIKELARQDLTKVDLTNPVYFLLQDIEDPINVGSLFRTADGCGFSLILTGTTPTPPHKEISLTSRGMDRRVHWEYSKSSEDKLRELKKDGYKILGLDLTRDSKVYFNYRFTDKVCIVLGNEAKGIYRKNLVLCDATIHIPMLGKNPSLNVNIAAGIVGYEFIRQNFAL